MNLLIFIGIIGGLFFLMVIDSNKSKNKDKKIRRGRDSDFDIDVKKLVEATKRMEILHQEQEICRISNRFGASSTMNPTSTNEPVIRLNRNF